MMLNGLQQCLFRRRRSLRMFVYFVCICMLSLWWVLEQKTIFRTGKNDSVKGTLYKENITKLPELIKEVANIPTPVTDAYLNNFSKQMTVLCNGTVIGYDKAFAKLTDVVINPAFGHGRIGGENISSVLKQNEKDEYFRLEKGYFHVLCKKQDKYQFKPRSHLNDWINALELSVQVIQPSVKVDELTIAVMRYEYVNLYLTMTDWYNAFLVQSYFNIDPSRLNVLWIDGHPKGGLDKTWNTLFGNITRAGTLTQPVMYTTLLWGIMGYHSPLQYSTTLPLIEEFRHFFLSRHGIQNMDHLDCNKLNILFMWRRDYVAHPRNPSGEISRKIKNEEELLKAVNESLPALDVMGIQIDILPMKEQVRIISKVDILIGMHGAGLTHTLFLPKHAGLIEIFPKYWGQNKHFQIMAESRGLHYATWKNADAKMELEHHYTIVNVPTVVQMVNKMYHAMCPEPSDKL